jgi:peptidoglycan/LPS O-acetylase OafA/YrhL
VVVLHLVVTDSRLVRLLRSRALVAVGRWSYGVYLWHIPLVILVIEVLHGGVVLRLVAGALSVPLAAASFRYVEQPLLRRYGGRRTVPALGAAPERVLSPA